MKKVNKPRKPLIFSVLLDRTEKSRVVTVSSGGMLVQKLDVSDLQFEKMSPFDGTMAYAQNKRQQVGQRCVLGVGSSHCSVACVTSVFSHLDS